MATNTQTICRRFVEDLIEICLLGYEEARLVNQDTRSILFCNLADRCRYRSDSPYLKCAVNPMGDCQTCSHKETK